MNDVVQIAAGLWTAQEPPFPAARAHIIGVKTQGHEWPRRPVLDKVLPKNRGGQGAALDAGPAVFRLTVPPTSGAESTVNETKITRREMQ